MMDEKKVQDMMKKLNMNVREVEADRVVIRLGKKQTVILKPQVMVVNMMGREVYQITGTVVEDEDVRTVMEKTGKDRETVEQKLHELDSDLAKVIKELKSDAKKKK